MNNGVVVFKIVDDLDEVRFRVFEIFDIEFIAAGSLRR